VQAEKYSAVWRCRGGSGSLTEAQLIMLLFAFPPF